MPLPIEDYALVGDTQTAALIGRDGSVDWLCFPRFDSDACFAALLGEPSHGRWLLAPTAQTQPASRRYRPGSLVLETEHTTPEGVVRVLDFMPPRGRAPDIVRIVEGVSGTVTMSTELAIRFGYGAVVPWVRRVGGDVVAVAGPDGLCLRTPIAMRGENMRHQAQFSVTAGDRVPFVLTWFPSHEPLPEAIDAEHALRDTDEYWTEWSSRCTYQGPHREAVVRSLITLKALTYGPTGGIVAAPTTSLPEAIGGVRNWDYRYCWLRDATFTLEAFLSAGYTDEAAAWRDWLLRAVAGSPADLQILYGPAGERRITEFELPWLPGYEGSSPVRVGNAAAGQLQLDVYGEVMNCLFDSAADGVADDAFAWSLQKQLLDHLERAWRDPDEGIWEVRGPRRHFTHSKVMAWVAFDRGARSAERIAGAGDGAGADRRRALADEVHEQICREAYDAGRGAFMQYYGAPGLDASLLLMPLVGFLPATDPRIVGTIEAIEGELVRDGLVLRYLTDPDVDGLPAGEAAFLACSFWLADCYALLGRVEEATTLLDRLCALANDLGLLAEEYDVRLGRQVGNFPQAFSHVSLVATALRVTAASEGNSPSPS
ncbi:MAG: glycoside hydrolase family 15 protein [Actinomycetota bacterium]